MVPPMPTPESQINDFGLLISYVLPGFTALWGASYLFPEIRSLVVSAPSDGATLGGFLYMTVAAVAAGLTISTVRWLLIDTLHHWTGVQRPSWDFSRLQDNVAAYTVLNELHYKYYQFYANTFIALLFVYVARRFHSGLINAPFGLLDAGFLALLIILFAGSRDTLRKYYVRMDQVLRTASAHAG